MESVDDMSFQLEFFNVEGIRLEGERLRNLQAFLRKQNSLTMLSMRNWNLDSETTRLIFNEIDALEKINFVGTSFHRVRPYPSMKKNLKIEKITIDYVDVQSCMNYMKLLKNLPNLKKIRCFDFPRTPLTGILKTLSENNPKLGTIKFFNCRIPSVELKQVKKIKFYKCMEKYVENFLNVIVEKIKNSQIFPPKLISSLLQNTEKLFQKESHLCFVVLKIYLWKFAKNSDRKKTN
jgi:hypothetical protein